jgi:site-specific DNA-methyltransferase (adenine-specific)
MNIELYNGDCLELMKNIPDGSVDLVLTDPPYGTMMGQGNSPAAKSLGLDNCEWDKELPTEKVFDELSRVLRPNGKAVLFSQEPYTSELITTALPSLPFSYRAIWLKNTTGNPLKCNKAMIGKFEDICIFSKIVREETEAHPLRLIFEKELKKSGKTKREAIALFGSTASHYFTSGIQFRLPTEENFKLLKDNGFISLDFEYCKKINADFLQERYSKIKEETPSVFNLWQGGKSKSNVLEYAKDNDGYHPTQKPVKLLEDLIQTYSNAGNTVLDFTMGSGSTGVACANTGRNFIGIELNKEYFNIAESRINEALFSFNREVQNVYFTKGHADHLPSAERRDRLQRML